MIEILFAIHFHFSYLLQPNLNLKVLDLEPMSRTKGRMFQHQLTRTSSLHLEVLQAAEAESCSLTPGTLVSANLHPKAATVVPAQLPLEEFLVGVFDDRRSRNLFLNVWKSCLRQLGWA